MKSGFLKKLLIHTCVYFTVFSILIFSVMMLMFAFGVTKDAENIYDVLFSVPRMALALAFFFCFAFANCFYATETLKEWIKLTIHFIITTVGFFLMIYLPLGFNAKNAAVVIGLFILLYFIAYGIYRAIRGKIRRVKNVKSEYKPVYKK